MDFVSFSLRSCGEGGWLDFVTFSLVKVASDAGSSRLTLRLGLHFCSGVFADTVLSGFALHNIIIVVVMHLLLCLTRRTCVLLV